MAMNDLLCVICVYRSPQTTWVLTTQSVVFHIHFPIDFFKTQSELDMLNHEQTGSVPMKFPRKYVCVFKSHCWPISKTHMVFREIFSLQSSLIIEVKLSLTNYYWFPSVLFKPQ